MVDALAYLLLIRVIFHLSDTWMSKWRFETPSCRTPPVRNYTSHLPLVCVELNVEGVL